MTVPAKRELRGMLELVLRLSRMTWKDFAIRTGKTTPWLSNMVCRDTPVRESTLRELREHLLDLIEEVFDPYYPPSPGLDREWVELTIAVKRFLRAEITRVIPEPHEHLVIKGRRR